RLDSNTPGFQQVPTSNEWWSSVMFQRITNVGNTDERDSKANKLFPLFADPFAAMINSGVELGDRAPFAGIGLTHLTHRYVLPAGHFLDPLSKQLPDGRFPANAGYFFNYGSSKFPDQRLYEDIQVGLRDVVADATVLRYSDWTVTFDWAYQLQATLGK